MKVVHVLKRIEMIDHDIKDLRKLEKSLKKNKSFTTPIYMSIEKQINIMLDSRIKLLGLTIENPPADLLAEIEGTEEEKSKVPSKKVSEKKARPTKAKAKAAPKIPEEEPEDEITMLTQSQIDDKIKEIEKEREEAVIAKAEDDESVDDASVKLLDIALEKGTLNKKEVEKEKDKKKVRFFKDNFPGSEY
jgi:hypothetical protein